MEKTYTREHLEMVYKAGKIGIPLDDLIHTIDYLEREASKGQIKPDAVERGNGRRISRKRGRKGRSMLTLAITGYLGRQGPKGAHVKEIAKALKTKPANVVAWFYGTGKKLIKYGEVKKTGPNTFAYVRQGKSKG